MRLVREFALTAFLEMSRCGGVKDVKTVAKRKQKVGCGLDLGWLWEPTIRIAPRVNRAEQWRRRCFPTVEGSLYPGWEQLARSDDCPFWLIVVEEGLGWLDWGCFFQDWVG